MADEFTTGYQQLYLGKSTKTKPSFPGLSIGTQFVELDTGDMYVFDGEEWVLGNDNVNIGATLITGGRGVEAQVVDVQTVGLLEQILITLKKIEYHLMLSTDVNLQDQDVE